MLAAEPARKPRDWSAMASSFHTRPHTTNNPSAFSPNMAPPNNRYGPTIAAANINGQQRQVYLPQTTQPSPQASSEGDAPRQENNIMNVKGDLNSSLYQICLSLKRRLADVPGFDQFIAEMDEDEVESGDSTDPVTLMWNCLRRGFPLMTIYNALRPENPLKIDPNKHSEKQIQKAATFQFLQACLTDLKIPPENTFLITDLYGGDTTGFVKVTRVVNAVLDIIDRRGLLLPSQHRLQSSNENSGSTGLSQIQHVVQEIVTSERTYVQHLELLQQVKNEIEAGGSIPGDAIHDIFLNLNALLDFQRRFLIRIEQQNSLPESQQNWGQLFIMYKDSFRVYEPFIANQNRCNATVIRDWDKIHATRASKNISGLLDTQQNLTSFLIKPFQRLSKYPLLLDSLRSKGNFDQDRKEDLDEGYAAATSILHRANDAIGKEQRLAAVSDLSNRVEDWKGHKIDHFGDLLLHGKFTVVKGEGAKPVEREYKIYLFERILLCCKEINPNKPKNKMLGNNKPPLDNKGRLRLQLKGRIFMQNVTDVLSFVKTEKASYTIQIFWKGDPGVEDFVIRFNHEAEMNKWRDQVQQQKLMLKDSTRSSGQTVTSNSVLTSMKDQEKLENPYLQNDDNEDEDEPSQSMINEKSDFVVSRNASSNSLRTTGLQSVGTLGRVAPPRFPFPDSHHLPQPLSLNTNIPQGANSPGEFPGNSYFSPSADSPSSTRSSSQTTNYPFPRQGTPTSQWSHEESKHRTAPAASGPPSRDGPGAGPLNAYQMNGRTIMRPSLPAMPANQAAHAAQQLASNNRMRSASTPNIHDPAASQNISQGRRYPNGQTQPTIDIVPVPPIPSHMAQMRGQSLNRSQTSSPTNSTASTRTATQSPVVHQERAKQYPDSNNYNEAHYQRQHPAQLEHRPHPTSGYVPPPITVIKSPPIPMHAASDDGIPYPSQLKVKIWFDPAPSHVTIVVPIIIKHRSLIDRIDSKMVKISSASISKGTARLKYKDMDDDFVTITSDEDVQLAIEDWGQAHGEKLRDGVVSDFELHWEEK